MVSVRGSLSLCGGGPSVLTLWSSRSWGHVALDCHFLFETARAFASQGARLGPPPKASHAETVTAPGLQLGWALLAGAWLVPLSHKAEVQTGLSSQKP